MTRILPKAAFLALLCCLASPGFAGESLDSTWNICREHTARAERARDLPSHLLGAIALTESGRWHAGQGANLAWPWTVMAEGRGRYLPSKAAAIETVRRLQAQGVRNIDVGCMQVNLRYHPEAFENLEEAFDPAVNVAYAADFLMDLRQEARSWTRAVGQYHSRRAIPGNRYRAKVFKAWREERHRANRERRARLQAAREAARQDQAS